MWQAFPCATRRETHGQALLETTRDPPGEAAGVGGAGRGGRQHLAGPPAYAGGTQKAGDLLLGFGAGAVPGAALADEFFSTARVLDRGSRDARIGKALGEMFGGAWLTFGGSG